MRSLKNISAFALLTIFVMTVFIPENVFSQTVRVLITAGSFHFVLPEMPGAPLEADSFFMDEPVLNYSCNKSSRNSFNKTVLLYSSSLEA